MATTPAAKIDPCPESADTRVVEDLEDNPATDDEDAKLEARKKAKRDRMKFNRSLESVLDETFLELPILDIFNICSRSQVPTAQMQSSRRPRMESMVPWIRSSSRSN